MRYWPFSFAMPATPNNDPVLLLAGPDGQSRMGRRLAGVFVGNNTFEKLGQQRGSIASSPWPRFLMSER